MNETHILNRNIHDVFEPTSNNMRWLWQKGLVNSMSPNYEDHHIPSVYVLYAYIQRIMSYTKAEIGCAVIALKYLERLINRTGFLLTALNWRHSLMGCLLISSKVWDDLSMINIDFCQAFPMFIISQLNQIEAQLLSLLQFDVFLSPREYADCFLSLDGQISDKPLTTPVSPSLRRMRTTGDDSKRRSPLVIIP